MTAPTPPDVLRRAAALLRERAQALGDNRGPWYVVTGPRGYPQSVRNKGVPYVVADCFNEPTQPPVTAAYIATVHPGVGLALAAWLEVEADVIAARTEVDGGGEWAVDIGGDHALAVARAVLGPEGVAS